jgi:Flp pilus assembly protein TadG
MKRLQAETASALLEFSLLVPLVVIMFLGVVDFGVAIAQAMTVQDAARAGAEYGTIAGNVPNTANGWAANGLVGFNTPVATTWCSCTAGGSHVGCTSSVTACSGGIQVQYVQVQTSANVQLLVNFYGTTSLTVNGLAVLRVQ